MIKIYFFMKNNIYMKILEFDYMLKEYIYIIKQPKLV
jgi:hypothetical protein